jgi:hypothetical protein
MINIKLKQRTRTFPGVNEVWGTVERDVLYLTQEITADAGGFICIKFSQHMTSPALVTLKYKAFKEMGLVYLGERTDFMWTVEEMPDAEKDAESESYDMRGCE